MKKGAVFLLFLIFSLGLFSAVAITDDLHLNIQTTDTSGNIVTGTFDFVFNISNTSDCSNIIYTNSTSLTTDLRGIISYYLPNVSLDYDQQYWLCYYRDGSLISNSKIARIPYAFRGRNVTLSGVEIDSNFDLGSYNFTTLGRIGIGTGSPGDTLDISGTDGTTSGFLSLTNGAIPRMQLMSYTADNIAINFDAYLDSGSAWRSSDAGSNFQIYKLADKLQFRYDSGQAVGSGLSWPVGFVLDTSGNVGIGTTSPDIKLDVNGSLRATGTTASTTGIGTELHYTGGIGYLISFDRTNILYKPLNILGTDISFGKTGAIRMTIEEGGNVGIGTTTPTQKLDVEGNINISGTTPYLYFKDGGYIYDNGTALILGHS